MLYDVHWAEHVDFLVIRFGFKVFEYWTQHQTGDVCKRKHRPINSLTIDHAVWRLFLERGYIGHGVGRRIF